MAASPGSAALAENPADAEPAESSKDVFEAFVEGDWDKLNDLWCADVRKNVMSFVPKELRPFSDTFDAKGYGQRLKRIVDAAKTSIEKLSKTPGGDKWNAILDGWDVLWRELVPGNLLKAPTIRALDIAEAEKRGVDPYRFVPKRLFDLETAVLEDALVSTEAEILSGRGGKLKSSGVAATFADAWNAQVVLESVKKKLVLPTWVQIYDIQRVHLFDSTTDSDGGPLTLEDLAALPDTDEMRRICDIRKFGLTDRDQMPSVYGAPAAVRRLTFTDVVPVFKELVMSHLPERMRRLLEKRGYKYEEQPNITPALHTFCFADDSERREALLAAARAADVTAGTAGLIGDAMAVDDAKTNPERKQKGKKVKKPKVVDTGSFESVVASAGGQKLPQVNNYMAVNLRTASNIKEDTGPMTFKPKAPAEGQAEKLTARGIIQKEIGAEVYAQLDKTLRIHVYDVAAFRVYATEAFGLVEQFRRSNTDGNARGNTEAEALCKKQIKERAGATSFMVMNTVGAMKALLEAAKDDDEMLSNLDAFYVQYVRLLGKDKIATVEGEYALKVMDRLHIHPQVEKSIALFKMVVIRLLCDPADATAQKAYAPKLTKMAELINKVLKITPGVESGEKTLPYILKDSFSLLRYMGIARFGYDLGAKLAAKDAGNSGVLKAFMAHRAALNAIKDMSDDALAEKCNEWANALAKSPDNVVAGFQLQSGAKLLHERHNSSKTGRTPVFLNISRTMVDAYQCGNLNAEEFERSYTAGNQYSRVTCHLNYKYVATQKGEQYRVRYDPIWMGTDAKPTLDRQLQTEMRAFAPVFAWDQDLKEAASMLSPAVAEQPAGQVAGFRRLIREKPSEHKGLREKASEHQSEHQGLRERLHLHRRHASVHAPKEPEPRPQAAAAPAPPQFSYPAPAPPQFSYPAPAPPQLSYPAPAPPELFYQAPALVAQPAAPEPVVQPLQVSAGAHVSSSGPAAVPLPRFMEVLATMAVTTHDLAIQGSMNVLVVPSDVNWARALPSERDALLRYIELGEHLIRMLLKRCMYTALKSELCAAVSSQDSSGPVPIEVTPYIVGGARMRLDLRSTDIFECTYTPTKVVAHSTHRQPIAFASMRVSSGGREVYTSCASGEENLAMDDALHHRAHQTARVTTDGSPVTVYVIAVSLDTPAARPQGSVGQNLTEMYNSIARLIMNASYATAAGSGPDARSDQTHALRTDDHPLLRSSASQAHHHHHHHDGSSVIQASEHYNALGHAAYDEFTAQRPRDPVPLAPPVLVPLTASTTAITPYYPGGSADPMLMLVQTRQPLYVPPELRNVEQAPVIRAPAAAQPIEYTQDGLPVPKAGMSITYETLFNNQPCHIQFQIVQVDPSYTTFVASSLDGTVQNARFVKRAGADGRLTWCPT